ncbi:glycosyl hydrolase family 18 protein [Bacillus sp. FJAT-28004]|uniref:glycosyl hydrolase family 18 protein n=1 Tax=Bacillus sp. FJAT-28004 TaxID=1679165 RepID=UPI0006B4D503|nr:glycosyl hydrolase family 18 protein [Bacillus sp. FJAT-28004]
MTKRNALIAACLLVVLIGAAIIIFSLMDRTKEGEHSSNGNKQHTADVALPVLSAWIVDWQWKQGLEDLSIIKGELTSLQLFAAYFDYKDSLYFTDKFQQALPEIMKVYKKNEQQQIYMTIVNDQFNENGESIQKDSSLITRLVASEKSRKKHVDELLAAVDQFGVNGIEINYERVEEQDWERVLLFYSELYARLQKEGKSLRIVLEPRAPIEQFKLPEGPDYVMMAYNLYGSHSGPGPNADKAFIEQLASRMEVLPGKPYMAFSVGGFDWREDGKVEALTEERAALLLKQTGSTAQRDQASGSMYFEYTDAETDNMKHTVWYADQVTISQWLDIAKRSGYSKAAIWRLGEIEMDSLSNLKLHTK